jgi:hypothetical protein
MSLPTPGTERECSGFAAVAAAAAAANAGNLNNNCTSTQQQGMSNGTYCQRRNKSALGKHRHQPYDRSPGGGSTCSTSSDESGNEDGETEAQGKPDQHVRKRTAANERERKRMHTVNSAFDQLRELVPTYPSSRKLSKIDTLKLACTYIQDLKTLLINSHIMPHGEDVVYHPDGYATTSPSPVYPGVHVKAEARYAVSQDYPASACTYPPFRVQQSYISDPDFSASEPENPSPPYYAPSSQASAAVIAVRPLSLSRTASDSAVSVHMQAAQQVSISMSSQQLPQSVPYPCHAPSSCPSLATVQHTSLPVAPAVTSPIQGHSSLPWQRTGSVPYPCVYSQ